MTPWDVLLPPLLVGVPTAGLSLLHATVPAMDGPGPLPGWAIITLIALELCSLIGIAVMIFVRYESGMRRLSAADVSGRERAARRGLLLAAVVAVTLFNVVSGVVGGLSGDRFFTVAGGVFYLLYVSLIGLTFAGLKRPA